MGYEQEVLLRDRSTKDEQAFAAGQRSVWISVAVNAVLILIQLFVGLWAHAYSLVADSLHSLSDLISDGFVLVANKRARRPADADHPYGHDRIETAASLALGIMLIVVGLGFLVVAGNRLQHLDSLPAIKPLALGAAILTLVAKEVLFRYQLMVAERVRSPMLVANAWHQRADAASSLVVAIGIGGSLLGFAYGDLLAAAIVGFMILRMGIKFSWEAMRELVDTGLPDPEIAAIRATLMATPGVEALHELRTRRMARHALVDTHIEVAPRISVSEGHRIAEEARSRVLKVHPDVLDVLVHIDPELDVKSSVKSLAPTREDLKLPLATLLEGLPEPREVVLHYLEGTVEAQVFFSCKDLEGEDLIRAQEMVDSRLMQAALLRRVYLCSCSCT
ncbi:MAG: cation diffusion facilitator family transporter [Azovibrio sp.]